MSTHPPAPQQGPPVPPPWWGAPPPPPAHPRAVTSMVLGIVGLGGLMFLLPFVVSPLAWYLGVVARRETERADGRWSPSGAATAGIVTGAIGTALLVAGVLVMGAMAALTWIVTGTDSGYGS